MSGSPSSSRAPKLTFPTTRSRPTSIVDTTAPSVEASTEAILSTSPASSIASTGASPRKHTQSAVDILASAKARDAAASKSQRVRTTSSTSKSGTEGSRPKLPSLLQATATRSSAAPATTAAPAQAPTDKLAEGPHAPSTSTQPQVEVKEAERGKATSRRGSQDESRVGDTKVAGPSAVKKSSTPPKRAPNAPPLVALLSDSSSSKLIKQGAEAKVYISRIATNNIVSWPQPRSKGLESSKVEPPALILLKWRFPKTYRHPTLSSSITASRTIMEARALLRCAKAGVAVPGVRCVDEKEGILGLELIPGRSVREWLGGGAEGEDDFLIDEDEATAAEEEEEEDVLSEDEKIKLMRLIGKQLAVMHDADIIHGDLTTSNMMLRPASGNPTAKVDLDRDEVVLIDFGLSSVSAFAEDKAVDLYVLERAFASTHPASEGLYRMILDSYAEEVTARLAGKNRGKGGKLSKWEETRRKLEEVRLRGRKRSMVGSALWKDNWDQRVVVNFSASVQFECHGVIAGVRALPGLVGAVMRLRPRDALRLVSAAGREQVTQDDDEWRRLASRMDAELGPMGTARLLGSHTEHESCVRTKPNEGKPWVSFALVPFQAAAVRVPFGGLVEKAVNLGLTCALRVADAVVPMTMDGSLGVRRKSKTN